MARLWRRVPTHKGKGMFRWYLITHNLHAHQLVTTKLAILGVEYYSPSKTNVRKRRDAKESVRITESPLFPGYIFVRLDPEIVHPSAVSDVPGVKEFVRFGGQISIIDPSLIDALRQATLLLSDRKVSVLELRNVPPEVQNAAAQIIVMTCPVARQAALFNLLQQDPRVIRQASKPYSKIATILEVPHVSETLQ